MRRLFDADHADRTVAVIFGIYFVAASVPLHHIASDRENLVYYDELWPYIFATAGLLSLFYAWTPVNRQLLAMSGSLMTGACISRAWAAVAALVLNTTDRSDARVYFGAMTWLAFGFGLSFIWIAVLVPLNDRRRRGA